MLLAAEPSPDERCAHMVFETLMWALAEPASVHKLPRPGLDDIAESLLDLEVTAFTPDRDLARQLRQTGTMQTTASDADYLFIPQPNACSADLIAGVKTGDPLYPDRAATIFLNADIGSGDMLRLSGPGINGTREMLLGGLPPEFWEVRALACRYPLGWDVFFIDGTRLCALPRSTSVEVLT